MTDMHRAREDHVGTQGEDHHLQDKETRLQRNQPCRHLVLLADRPVRKHIFLRNTTHLKYFIMAALEN